MAFRDQRVAIGPVALHSRGEPIREVFVRGDRFFGGLDAAGRFQPTNAPDGERARQPEPGRERRPILEQRRDFDYYGKVEVTAVDDLYG